MKKTIVIALSAAAFALISPAVFAAEQKAPTTEGAPTSDRTPGKETATPENQVDTTKSGETSDRTPGRHAEKTGDMGSSSTSMQTWNDSYQSTMAQEEQLKSGGSSKAKK
jgi:hypothetical protein